MLSEQRELKSNSILKPNESVLISILRIIIIQNKRLEIKIKKFFKWITVGIIHKQNPPLTIVWEGSEKPIDTNFLLVPVINRYTLWKWCLFKITKWKTKQVFYSIFWGRNLSRRSKFIVWLILLTLHSIHCSYHMAWYIELVLKSRYHYP